MRLWGRKTSLHRAFTTIYNSLINPQTVLTHMWRNKLQIHITGVTDFNFFKFLCPFQSFRSVIYEVALDISVLVTERILCFSSFKGLAKGKWKAYKLLLTTLIPFSQALSHENLSNKTICPKEIQKWKKRK